MVCVQLTGSPIVEDKTSNLQIAGKRCIHYASQDRPIHIQSGTGFMTLQALQNHACRTE